MKSSITIAGLLVMLFIPIFAQQPCAQTITSDKTGDNGGFYYSFWNQGGGSVSMTLGAGGNYSATWTSCNNFTCGKGWRTGSTKPVCYTATFDGGGNGYLALYGWTKNPLIEYYIVENHGSWTPPGGTSLGTVTTDDGTYNIYKMRRTNAASILGTQSFDQFWSVRTKTRSSGTITVKNHFDAWASHQLTLGTFDYEIMETEGYQSSGNSNVTVYADCSDNVISNNRISSNSIGSKISLAGKNILITLPSNIQHAAVSVEISDLSGKRLFASTMEPRNAQLKISSVNLPEGEYYAQIRNKGCNLIIPFVMTK